MKTHLLVCPALALLLAACAQSPKPQAAVAAPAPAVVGAPTVLIAPEPAGTADPALLAAAQTDLRALGYAAGKSGDTNELGLAKAVLAFEKDQGLPQDGQVTEALVDRMKLMRAELPKSAPAAREAIFAYDDGATSRQALGLLMAPPHGLVSNAPVNFMQPLRPGAQASYQLGKLPKDGSFMPIVTVTCHVGRITQANVPAGQMDVIAVDCHGDGTAPLQWSSLYSPALGLVVRQERDGGAPDLVAVRPFTGDWPSAARTGLDWAVTHVLDGAPSSPPVQWSSTGVAAHFEIKAAAKIPGHDAGLSGRDAVLSCRRFEMVQNGQPTARYPGIACQNAAGGWYVPGTAIQFATPANGLPAKSLPALRSAQN
jgi:hypothetical protein